MGYLYIQVCATVKGMVFKELCLGQGEEIRELRISIGVIFHKTDHLVEDKGKREMTLKKRKANLKLPATQFNRKESIDLNNFWKIVFVWGKLGKIQLNYGRSGKS